MNAFPHIFQYKTCALCTHEYSLHSLHGWLIQYVTMKSMAIFTGLVGMTFA